MALLGWMYGEKTKRQLQNFGATTTKKKEVNSRGFLDILITGYNYYNNSRRKRRLIGTRARTQTDR